jgi:hypothetical protein
MYIPNFYEQAQIYLIREAAAYRRCASMGLGLINALLHSISDRTDQNLLQNPGFFRPRTIFAQLLTAERVKNNSRIMNCGGGPGTTAAAILNCA